LNISTFSGTLLLGNFIKSKQSVSSTSLALCSFLGDIMYKCTGCGAELPLNARFCGSCGRLVGATENAQELTSPSDVNLLTMPSTPPFFSNPSLESDITVRHSEPPVNQDQAFTDKQTDENYRVIPDFPLPLFPAGGGQAAGNNAPFVHGTPQVGEVPAVQGTPAQGALQQPQPASWQQPAHPQQAPSMMPHPSSVQEQPQGVHFQNHPSPTQPVHPPIHHDPKHPHPLRHPHHPLQQTQIGGRSKRLRQAHHSGTHTVAGIATKWIILVVTGIVVLVISGVLIVLASPPALSLVGSSSVPAGAVMHVHGSHFTSGGHVTFTVDKNVPVHVVNNPASARGHAVQMAALAGGAADIAQLANLQQQRVASNDSVAVGADGSFDAYLQTGIDWTTGSHTLHAYESQGNHSADMSFTLTTGSGKLVVNPSTLDFGTVPKGRKVVQAVLIGNDGGTPLSWKAATDGSQWVSLTNATGVAVPHGMLEPLYVTIDTGSLSVGSANATINIIPKHGANIQVPVRVNVAPPDPVKQAILSVNPPQLNFGQVVVGQQGIQALSVGNLGSLGLKWQASAADSWLTLSTSSGSIRPGDLPQSVQVIVDTSSLQAGSYSSSITFSSNGGKIVVQVTLAVKSNGGGSPSPTPTQVVPGVYPSGFSEPGDPNCSYDNTSGWTCQAVVGLYANVPNSFNWTASAPSFGNTPISFDPAGGTLTSGQTARVTISIPLVACSASVTLTFTIAGVTVPATWSCATPTLTADKTSFNGNKDCSFNNGWTCKLNLGTNSGDQGLLNWSATSSGINGITISPASGTVAGGRSTPVSFTVPFVDCSSGSGATLTFTAQGASPVIVNWSCTSVSLQASDITANSDCTYNNGWSCSDTVSLNSNNPGDPTINWSASSSINGVTFSPASGVVAPGQSITVSISVPSMSCPANGQITFAGQGAGSATVNWKCNAPTLSVSPSSFSVPDNGCSYTAGQGWSCNVTISVPNKGDPASNWSVTGGNEGTSFSASSGTVWGGNPQTVTINIPDTVCPSQSTFTFSGPNTVTVTWSCAAPTLQSSPSGASTCPQNSDGSFSCTVTLSLANGSQGDLNWSASSSLNGVTFNPASGTLNAGGSSQSVAINIPSSDCTYGTFTFQGQNANSVTYTWNCQPATPPKMYVSPTGLSDTSGSPCSLDSSSNTWSCTVTVSEDANSSGNLNWSVSSSLSGVVFNPPGGTLSPGQSTQVVISNLPCSGATFTFSDGASSITVSWSCGSSTIFRPGESFAPLFLLIMSQRDQWLK
jgi:hypothetical protein